MKFSLIVCTYMRPKAIVTLLNSVKEQTLYPDEIIIVDGSVDTNTQELFLSKSFKNLNYFLVEEEQRGLTKQRNFGISKVAEHSEIICFLDDDIVLDSNYFEELIKTYTKFPNAMAVGGYATNEIVWNKNVSNLSNKYYVFDGFARKESSRFKLRNKLGLLDNTLPGFMPTFSHGRSVSFLPPSGKTYEIEQIMGGISSYRKEIFSKMSFSTYFEGYGLYEDADFSLRLAKKGKIYLNTNAKVEHHHATEGRPNKFKYGKMVIRNGWYVWHVKYPKPTLNARLKWNLTSLVLTVIRASNIVTTSEKKEAFTETLGRVVGWFSLIFNKPKVK
ncbi:glycosyl transferase family 2 [Tenacibaculum todarodis]|uniref:Glycosyl transferase family 2 n=1 Tax=Tenacibaculum todarodis TaxID=1850252 RepID=A0A1L3JHR8_9FLAO|nr:glycosyltransferase family 2 protein [Tenacibaculum todarodis]APG64691.1 glycosyl transferase family 2 [Tenacibaculum todarodis]